MQIFSLSACVGKNVKHAVCVNPLAKAVMLCSTMKGKTEGWFVLYILIAMFRSSY